MVEERKPVKIWKGALAGYTPRGDVPEGLCGQTTRKADWKKRAVTFMILERTMPEFSCLKIKGHKGQRIDIQCGELLENGALKLSEYLFLSGWLFSERHLYRRQQRGRSF